jgi:hypothetical protein
MSRVKKTPSSLFPKKTRHLQKTKLHVIEESESAEQTAFKSSGIDGI